MPDALVYLILAAIALLGLIALPFIVALLVYIAPIAIAVAVGLWLYHAI